MAEAGRDTSLVCCLHPGVAYHYSNHSQGASWLIESLIRREEVSVVCAMTASAQEMNLCSLGLMLAGTFQTISDERYSEVRPLLNLNPLPHERLGLKFLYPGLYLNF
jgi:hypothetical protein